MQDHHLMRLELVSRGSLVRVLPSATRTRKPCGEWQVPKDRCRGHGMLWERIHLAQITRIPRQQQWPKPVPAINSCARRLLSGHLLSLNPQLNG